MVFEIGTNNLLQIIGIVALITAIWQTVVWTNTSMKPYLTKRKAETDKRRYNNGYDWAAGALLRGEDPMSVQYQCAYDEKRSELDDFDMGAHAAIDALLNLNILDERDLVL